MIELLSRHFKHLIAKGFHLYLAILALLMLSGCIAKSLPPKPTYYYTLDYKSPVLDLKRQLPVTLRIERFSVSPPFQTQRIIYAEKGTMRKAYSFHKWIAAPGDLIPYLLVRDLRKTKGFKAVLTPDASSTATHSLHGWVEEFLESDTPSNCRATAIIHITLINNLNSDPSRKIMLQKRYQANAPCKSKTPAAFASSMSVAFSDISKQIAHDVHSKLSTITALNY